VERDLSILFSTSDCGVRSDAIGGLVNHRMFFLFER
jgi:hypothetical protein